MEVIVLVLVAIAFAAAAPALYALRQRVMDARELELAPMLVKRGLEPGETPQEARAFAAALRRCVLCTNISACRQWLAGDSVESPRDFCPNAGYLDRLQRR